jgi:nucleolar protein 15
VEEEVAAKPSKKVERFKEKPEKDETGVVYVGHLPYGFVEAGLHDFFSQYGTVKRVKLMRSKKTARSKGYSFVEFENREVARVAADSMNGYIMYGRPLDVRLLENSQRNKFQLVRAGRKFKFVPWQIIYRNSVNKVSLS